VLTSLLAQLGQPAFDSPTIDWHALAPEIVLTASIAVLIIVDVIDTQRAKAIFPALAGLACLAATIPVITLATSDADRYLFDGLYAVDDFSLVMKGMFLLVGYVVVLMSTNYIAEGDYWESEYYTLLLSSLLGMMVMASARDLITIFVALELLSIPAYMLATWRKRDLKSNEAGLKYYLMGVFASAILLYGMSLVYGVSGTTLLAGIDAELAESGLSVVALGVVFVIVGFAFKVSAVPFHTWAPDVYEGAPTPVTAFLATASKAAGFVALVIILAVGFASQSDITEPMLWFLAIITMFVGNLTALRQTNVVRMLAYSGIAQAGYILAALAVLGDNPDAIAAVVSYLVIYMAMNLGAFAVVMAVARKTGSAEIESFGGLVQYAPGLAAAMTVFLFALAGIPPLGGWFAKLQIFIAVVEPGTWQGYTLGAVVAVNSVIALFYYAKVARFMWMEDAPDGDTSPVKVPVSLTLALGITTILTLGFGVLPGAVADLGDAATDLSPDSVVSTAEDEVRAEVEVDLQVEADAAEAD
jgi:NADH-quinone oxidoreductase subunit N